MSLDQKIKLLNTSKEGMSYAHVAKQNMNQSTLQCVTKSKKIRHKFASTAPCVGDERDCHVQNGNGIVCVIKTKVKKGIP